MTAEPRTRTSPAIRNLALVFAVVGILYLAREILIPLAFAIVLSMILAPAVALLQKLHVGRVASALVDETGGRTYPEVAEYLGLHLGTVHEHLRRIRLGRPRVYATLMKLRARQLARRHRRTAGPSLARKRTADAGSNSFRANSSLLLADNCATHLPPTPIPAGDPPETPPATSPSGGTPDYNSE